MSKITKIGNSRVLESRELADGVSIRRRRETPDGRRFTTYERIERRNIVVVKRDGKRELFDREKLSVAINRSVGKFFSSEMEIEKTITKIENRVYELGDNELTSVKIGTLVLEELAKISDVAYIRFASVFYDFRTLDDFVRILKEQQELKKGNNGSFCSL